MPHASRTWSRWAGAIAAAVAVSGVRWTHSPQPIRSPIRIGRSRAGRRCRRDAPGDATSAVEIDPDGKSIWVAERCGANTCAGSTCPRILKFDADGRLVKSFGAGMFIFPHGIHVDREGNVWVTDARGKDGKGHQVFKFSPEGKLLLTLGKAGVAGEGPTPSTSRPTSRSPPTATSSSRTATTRTRTRAS